MQQNIIKPKSKKRIPFQDKNKKPKQYEFLYSSAICPHPEKISKGGEDAVFVSKNVLVIADGVGSWKQFGVDPGLYSKKLIENVSKLLQDEEKRMYYIENPQKLACAAVNLNKEQGSSTLSILTLHPTSGVLRSYHIGDSVYGIFHQTGQHILAAQQQYLFNHPYQVGSNFIHRDSQQEMEFCKPDSGVYNQFHYSQIKQSHVVLASDGIWDNLFAKDIHGVLKEVRNGKVMMEKENDGHFQQYTKSQEQNMLNWAVDRLINMTHKTYSVKDYESPFYFKGRQHGLNVGKFAKVDDLSLIVAKVVERQLDQIQ